MLWVVRQSSRIASSDRPLVDQHDLVDAVAG
jgi:hypothetical protein